MYSNNPPNIFVVPLAVYATLASLQPAKQNKKQNRKALDRNKIFHSIRKK